MTEPERAAQSFAEVVKELEEDFPGSECSGTKETLEMDKRRGREKRVKERDLLGEKEGFCWRELPNKLMTVR